MPLIYKGFYLFIYLKLLLLFLILFFLRKFQLIWSALDNSSLLSDQDINRFLI